VSAGAALLRPRYGRQRNCPAGRHRVVSIEIEAEPRRAVGTQDRVRLAHIDVDVRVVLRWGLADTHELLHPMQISGTPRAFLNFG